MEFTITKVRVKKESYDSRRNEPYRLNTKLYIFPENETILENLTNRHNRPSNFYKKNVIPQILEMITEPEIKAALKGDWKWRTRCGCTCPCSPGFILSDSGRSYTIYATVKFVGQEVELENV